MITLIFASDPAGVIGYRGNLPWKKLTGDLKRFKELTLNHTVVMGRKTLKSLPGSKPLTSRHNIVLTRNITLADRIKSFWYNLTHASSSLDFADDIDSLYSMLDLDDETFVIGGAEIFKALEPMCNRMIWTKTKSLYVGDTFFKPSIIDWQLRTTTQYDEYDLQYFRKKY